MNIGIRTVACVGLVMGLVGCGRASDGICYTLYRTSMVSDQSPKFQRTHVATFDANYEEAVNRENCDIARRLFQSQPGVEVRYWCEKGRYER